MADADRQETFGNAASGTPSGRDGSPDLGAALKSIVERLGCSAGTIHLFDPAADSLDLAAAIGIPMSVRETVATVPVGKGMAGIAAKRRAPVQVCNLQTDASGVARPGARDTKMEGALAVPLLTTDGELKGVIGVAKSVAYDFSANECDLLLAIGTSIADRL